MSGIVGIVHLDGAPVDRRVLVHMTNFLAFRGPDAQEIWMDGNFGFGHTLLKTTDESDHERQPLTLDGRVWIVADARVDARSELIWLLQTKQQEDLPANVPDVALILRAYQVWGEDCVEHLLGDFVFAIWDDARQCLFCARDHMGVKPFYYAHLGQKVIFSNTLECIRQHPAVSDRLNDLAIADFLLADSNQDPVTTTFADIQRLPPAHIGVWSGEQFRFRRYWIFPIDEPFISSRKQDYPERFRELLREAVSDRLRTKHIGIYMSGGLDSSGIAATACGLLRESRQDFSLQAFTAVFDHLMPDRERYYAGLVAKHLAITLHPWVRDNDFLTPWADQTPACTPEPVTDPFDLSFGFEYQRHIASYSRVFLYGEGPDNALYCDWRAHISGLAREGRWHRFLPDLWWHVVGHPRVPFVGRLTSRLKGYTKRGYPPWLNPALARRLDLHSRWLELQADSDPCHPARPKGYRGMATSLWQDFFGYFDHMYSRNESELRHPYLDIRLARFMLSVPAIPWCCNKYLSRCALDSVLPEQVVRRSKSPLARDPSYERARRAGMPEVPVSETLLCYVVPSAVPARVGRNIEQFRMHMRAVGLAYWLRYFEAGKTTVGKATVDRDESCATAREASS
jgi:asparagine synthase (glutamine-hydrolysing)